MHADITQETNNKPPGCRRPHHRTWMHQGFSRQQQTGSQLGSDE